MAKTPDGRSESDGAPGRSRTCDPRIRSSRAGSAITHAFSYTSILTCGSTAVRQSAVDCARLQPVGDTLSDIAGEVRCELSWLEKGRQLGEIRNFEVRLWHIAAARPTIAVDPRDPQTCCLRALDVVHLTVADVQNFVRLNPHLFQCSLEHKGMWLVGSHRFGDEDEVNGQCEFPRGEVLMIGIGNDCGAYMPERVQRLERLRVELDLRRNLKEKINVT